MESMAVATIAVAATTIVKRRMVGASVLIKRAPVAWKAACRV